MSNYDPFKGGKASFARGKPQKPLNDKRFVSYFNSLKPTAEGVEAIGMGRAMREAKQEAMLEWKRGWLEARDESEKPVEPVAKKKTTKKKTSKKKVSKKKSKK